MLSFMAAVLGCPANIEAVSDDKVVKCVLDEAGVQQVITGPASILRVLATEGKSPYYGGSPAAKAEMDGWFFHIFGVRSSSAATSLLQLMNLRLLTRSFILGPSITAVDHLAYFVLFKAFSEKSANEQILLCNTARWFDALGNIEIWDLGYTGNKVTGPTLPLRMNMPHCPIEDVLAAKAHSALQSVMVPKPKSKTPGKGKSASKQTPAKGPGTPSVKGKGAKTKQPKSKTKQKGPKGQKGPKAPKSGPVLDFGKTDIRVGYVLKAWKNPDADKLYSEEIDVGEDKPRHIASGIWGKVEASEFEKSKVLVLCNLPPKAVPGGKVSNGMVICSCAGDKVELVRPPADAKIGERVTIEGFTSSPAAVKWMNKKLSKFIREFSVSENHSVCFMGKPFMTSAGPCKSPKFKGSEVTKVG